MDAVEIGRVSHPKSLLGNQAVSSESSPPSKHSNFSSLRESFQVYACLCLVWFVEFRVS